MNTADDTDLNTTKDHDNVLKQILEVIPFYVFWKDIELNYVGCNRVFAEAAGLKSSDAIAGKSDYELAWSTEEADWYRECDLRVIEQNQQELNIEETQEQADGTQTTILTSKVPLHDEEGTVTGVLGVFADVTAMKKNEEKQRLQSAALDAAVDGLLITDRDGIIVWLNPAVEAMTGYSEKELLGENPRKLCSGKQDPAFYAQLWKTISAGKVWRGELTNCRKDGKLYLEQLSITPVTDEEGVVTHYAAVKVDITEKREMEAEREQGNRLESIGQLAAGIAHEINTPTQFIRDNTRFLQDAVGDLRELLHVCRSISQEKEALEDPAAILKQIADLAEEADLDYLLDEMEPALEQSLDGLERIATIVRSMKEFSHPGDEGMQLADLCRAIKNTVTVARNEWKYVADVELDLEPQMSDVECRVGEINQALLNMIVNAAHAIEEAQDADDPQKGTITIRCQRVGPWAEIRISDTGCGIPRKNYSRIFDQFFTTKAVGKGTGQGLGIAYNVVVKRHSGTLDFESTVGNGTTFILRIPMAQPDRAP